MSSPPGEIINSLTWFNEFLDKGSLRRYQHQLLEHGAFIGVTGNKFNILGTYVKNDCIAYCLDFEQPIWIVVKSIQFGFPLVALYNMDFTQELWRTSEAPLDKIVINKELSILEVESKKYLEGIIHVDSAKVSNDVVVQIGHQNFAHYIWNELPGLHSFLAKDHNKKLLLALERKPINIDWARLFPNVISAECVSGFTQTIVVKTGSTHMSSEYLKFIRNHFRYLKNESVYPVVDFSLWVTVRNDGRTCLNQDEFLEKAISRIYQDSPYAKLAVVFDGFSFPDDFPDNYSEKLVDKFNLRSNDVYRYIDELITTLKSKKVFNNPEKDLVFFTTEGMSVSATIKLSENVDFYISHIGSIQHKVSWIYNPRGFVHGNQSSITNGAQKWLERLTEMENRISYIAPENIEDANSIRIAGLTDRNKDYYIKCDEKLLANLSRICFTGV